MQKKQLIHTFGAGLDLFGTISDFTKFGHFHPYMVRVTLLGEDENGKEYLVEEEVPVLGIFNYTTAYRATVLARGKEIMYRSFIKKLLRLQITWRFERSASNETILLEDIEIGGNALLRAIFMRVLQKAHLQTMEAVRKAFSTQ